MCNTTWVFKLSVVLSFRNERRCMFCISAYCGAETPTTYCLGYPFHTDVGEVIALGRRHKETRGINCSLLQRTKAYRKLKYELLVVINFLQGPPYRQFLLRSEQFKFKGTWLCCLVRFELLRAVLQKTKLWKAVNHISKDHITFICTVKWTSSRKVFPKAYLLLVATSYPRRLEFYCAVLNNSFEFLECRWRNVLFTILMRF